MVNTIITDKTNPLEKRFSAGSEIEIEGKKYFINKAETVGGVINMQLYAPIETIKIKLSFDVEENVKADS